ncbi:MAG: VCBS repeat-containing protein, partial [Verrucomicrobia bacterium]|nr:VCBS repeat-containing protein [Verrucomicrobiota bacterium]
MKLRQYGFHCWRRAVSVTTFSRRGLAALTMEFPFKQWPIGILCWVAGLGLTAAEWRPEGAGRLRALPPASGTQPGFTSMESGQTGVTFSNLLSEARSLTNHILMNGSGVALGDMDGDGWCDVFLAGLDGRSTLYRNLGNWRFGDVTSGALPDGGDPEFALRRLEASGAVFADLDGDGF